MSLKSVYQTKYFVCKPCEDCDVPGYLILIANPSADAIAGLSPEHLASFGDTLAKIEDAVKDATKAERVYVLRFSEGLRDVHFHIFPRTAALASQFLEEVKSAQSLIGEDIFSWARRKFKTNAISEISIETAAQIQTKISGRHSETHKTFYQRFVSAMRNTYGFEKPERKEETNYFSPLIWGSALLMFFSKMFWGVELVRFLVRWFNTKKDEAEVHPAWSDLYAILMPLITLFLIIKSNSVPPFSNWVFYIYGTWRLFESITLSFHSLVTRSVFGGRPARSEFRYLVATVLRSIEAWLSLILMWNIEKNLLLSTPSSISPGNHLTTLHVAYFVTTTISTVGYGDFAPNPNEPFALILAVVTQITAIIMLTILVSKAFSLISPRIGPVK